MATLPPDRLPAEPTTTRPARRRTRSVRLRRPGRAAAPLAALLVAAALLAACGGGAPPPGARPLGDLGAEIAVGQFHQELPALDLGTPAARPALVSGWSWDERDGEGSGSQGAGGDSGRDTSFAWGVGEQSVVRFFLTEPRDLTIRLHGRPFAFDGASPQTVEVEVDGRPLSPPTRWVLDPAADPGVGTYTVTVPENSLRAGFNRLTLRYAWARSPRELGLSNDSRALAVAWYGMELSPVPPPPAGAASTADAAAATGEVAGVSVTTAPSEDGSGTGETTVRLPFGAGVDVFVRVPTPPGARTILAIDHLEAVGATGSLDVEIEEEGTEPVRAARVGPVDRSGRRVLLDLPLRPGTPPTPDRTGSSGQDAGNGEASDGRAGRMDGGAGQRLLRIGLWAVPKKPGTAGALELHVPQLLTTAPAAPAPGPATGPSGASGPSRGERGARHVA